MKWLFMSLSWGIWLVSGYGSYVVFMTYDLRTQLGVGAFTLWFLSFLWIACTYIYNTTDWES